MFPLPVPVCSVGMGFWSLWGAWCFGIAIMRLVYMGTPRFAVQPLLALHQAGHQIVGVVSRTDKPAGRGRMVAVPEVKQAARELGLTVLQPKQVRDPEFIETLRGLAPEAIVAAAYGQILPKAVLDLPRYGCINIHASLLPAYRGAAPINWAIIRGDRETGVTIMQMDEGLDTGAILLQGIVPIEEEDTAGTLTEKLSSRGAELITSALPRIASGSLMPKAQDQAKASLAPLLSKHDGLIDWTLSAKEIHNRVRGFKPWPGSFTFLDGAVVKILRTEVLPGSSEPGCIFAPSGKTMEVGTGEGMVRIVTIQPAGGKPMPAAAFLSGHRNIAGRKFSRTEQP